VWGWPGTTTVPFNLSESRLFASADRSGKDHRARNCRQNHPDSTSESNRKRHRIVVKRADDRDLRIENTLIDENGYEVRLKKGAHVEVTVTARAER
jgi:hypothetical protein